LSLSVGPNLNLSQMPGNQSEGTIAIDRTNPARLFAASNLELGGGLFAATSGDGGATWVPRLIANGSDGLPVACCDPQAAFDQFGNLFLTYVTQPRNNAVVALSTDGGQTFSAVLTDPHVDDQPSIATGPGDLPGTGSVWISYHGSATDSILATGARVTGLGQVGTFLTPELVPGSAGGNFGGIAVGPDGQVMVTYQTPTDGAGPSTIFANRNLGGLAGGFSRAFTVESTNMGGFTPIPAQPNRTIDAEANLAWDRSGGPHNGRAYLAFTDRAALGSDRTEVFLTFSDNNGRNWSTPVRVNDVGRNSHFLPALALDQSTGDVAVTWYDCRNDRPLGRGGWRGGVPRRGGGRGRRHGPGSGRAGRAPGRTLCGRSGAATPGRGRRGWLLGEPGPGRRGAGLIRVPARRSEGRARRLGRPDWYRRRAARGGVHPPLPGRRPSRSPRERFTVGWLRSFPSLDPLKGGESHEDQDGRVGKFTVYLEQTVGC
jgi:hypothetical protein